jgi:putative heme-binding domain-containing protein
MLTRATFNLITAAVCVATAQDVSRPAQFTQADREAGAQTFRSHCSPCHGMKAEGGRGPNLAQGVFFRGSSDEQLLKNISDGIDGTEMPGLFYSPDRVWQVVAYLRSLAPNEPATGDRARGAQLFASKGCAGCHRIAGQGGRMGPDLSTIGSSRALPHLREAMTNPDADVRQRYWMVAGMGADAKPIAGFLLNEDTYTVQFIGETGNLESHAKAGLRGYAVRKKSRMPSFAQLPAAELDDLVVYLNSLRRTGGSR